MGKSRRGITAPQHKHMNHLPGRSPGARGAELCICARKGPQGCAKLPLTTQRAAHPQEPSRAALTAFSQKCPAVILSLNSQRLLRRREGFQCSFAGRKGFEGNSEIALSLRMQSQQTIQLHGSWQSLTSGGHVRKIQNFSFPLKHVHANSLTPLPSLCCTSSVFEEPRILC